MSDVRTGQFTRTNSFSPTTRDPVQPRFHIEPIVDEVASASAGRPIYRNEERVQFIMPGSPNQPVFRVTDEHRQRWGEAYAAFKRGEATATEGTPLEQWPILTRAQVLEMKALGIRPYPMVFDPVNARRRLPMGGYNRPIDHRTLAEFQRWVIRKAYNFVEFEDYDVNARGRADKYQMNLLDL